MLRAVKIILSILLALLIAGGLVVFYIYFIAGGSLPNIAKDWFPTNSNEPGDGGAITVTPDPNQVEEETPLPTNALVQISRDAVGGAGFRESAATTTVLFVERETGNFFAYIPSTNERVRLTNATLPRIQEAVFSADGSRALLRYLGDDNSTIETYMADVPATPNLEAGELSGSFLARDISAVTAAPGGSNFFYLTPTTNGVTGFITAPQADPQVWNSGVSEWIPVWTSPSALSLQTSASGVISGYAYLFNKDSKSFTRLIGNVRGLTVLVRPDLKAALYSQSGEGWVTLSLLDIANNSSSALPARTLPEKCVWKNKQVAEVICAVPNEIIPGTYPDLWYQGATAFSDSLWLIDTETSEIFLLADLKGETEMDIDAINLAVSQNDDLLIFKNKRDGSLWKLSLPRDETE